MFKIKYTDSVKTIKLNVNDDNLEFIDGYALVEKELTEAEMAKVTTFNRDKITLNGIVDESFREILPFKDNYENIKIFKNGNFIVTIKNQYKGIDVSNSKTIHYRYNKEKQTLEEISTLPNKYYKIIDDDKIIITDQSFSSIYSLEEGRTTSYKFTSIGDFENGIALAEREVKLDNLSATIYCYIYKSGNIKSSLYSTFDNSYTNLNDDFKFDDYINSVKNNLQNKKDKIERDLKLLAKK